MKTILAAVAISLMTSSIAAAQDEPVMGGGHAQCRVLVSNDAFVVNHANMQWLLGYLSGTAMVAEALNRRTGGTSALPRNFMDQTTNQLVVEARNRCRAEPDKRLYQVATDIMILLSG